MDREKMTAIELSVLIPVYNAEKTLSAAIWSVLNQNFTHFELLLYVDGAEDASMNIARGIVDSRIRIFSSDEKKGIVHARNTLLQEAKGKYIAWLDADDIALPGRFAAQINYLTTHPQLQILGSWSEVRNSKLASIVRWPTKPEVLDAWLFYRNPLVQSSVMARNPKRSILFDAKFEYLEDYHWYSSYLGYNCIGLLPQVFCSYLDDSESGRIKTYIKYDFVGKLEQIMLLNFQKLNLNPGKNGVALLREFLRGSKRVNKVDGLFILNFLKSAMRANKEKKLLDVHAFNAVNQFEIMRLFFVCKQLRFRIFCYFLIRPSSILPAMLVKPRYKKN